MFIQSLGFYGVAFYRIIRKYYYYFGKMMKYQCKWIFREKIGF